MLLYDVIQSMLTRMWCLFEIFVCVEYEIKLEVAMPASLRPGFHKHIIKASFFDMERAHYELSLNNAAVSSP